MISTVLLTISLASAVPASHDIAPATIVACPTDAPEKCKIVAPTVKRATATTMPGPWTFVMLMLGLVILGVASHRSRPDQFLKD